MEDNAAKTAELRELYASLYGGDGSFDSFLAVINEKHAARPAELLALDERRLANPKWYLSPDIQGITMYTELFAGDLKRLKDKVPYLKELGITYLHLMPLMQMPRGENDGGYAVEDFNKVDPKFGTNEDLANLTKALREHGISMCMDFVMNHTASTHWWALKAEEGDARYMDYYMTYPDRTIPDRFEATVPEVFPTTAPGNFIWNEKMQRWVFSSFYPFQWDLNYRNPEVLREMVSSMLEMANLGVEVFRLDAVPYIWKTLGTNCRNLPEVHTIVRMMRLALELAAPAVIFKGEVVMAPSELAAYFGPVTAPECHLLYGVSSMVNLWSALASEDVTLLKYHLEDILSLPSHCAFVNYIRCHDDIGWGLDEPREKTLGIDPLAHKIFLYNFYSGNFPMSYARGQLYNHDWDTKDARSCGTTASLCGLERALIDKNGVGKERALRRILLMHAAIFSLKGFPMLSSGDEIGQLNDYSYMNDLERAADERNVHRSPYRWDFAELRNTPGTYQNTIWHGIEELREKRRHELFSPDAEVYTWDSHNKGVLGLRRRLGGKVLLCVLNFTPRTEYARFEYFTGEYRDVFTNRVSEPGKGFEVPPYGYMWLEGTWK